MATAFSKYSSAHSTWTHPSFWRHSSIVDVSDREFLMVWMSCVLCYLQHPPLDSLGPGSTDTTATIKTVFRHLLGRKIIPG